MDLVKVSRTWMVLEGDQVVVASREFKIFGQNGKVLAEGVKLRDWCKRVGVTDVCRVQTLTEKQATACCEYILRMQQDVPSTAAQTVDEEQEEFRELLLSVCEKFDWELAEIVSAVVEYRITNEPGEVVHTKNFTFISEEKSSFLAVVQWATASEAKRRLQKMEESCDHLPIALKENCERRPRL